MSRCSVVDYLHSCSTNLSYPCLPHVLMASSVSSVYRLQEICNTDEEQRWKKLGKKPTSMMIKSTSEPPTDSFHVIYRLDQDAAGSIGQWEFAIMITTETAHLVLDWSLLVFQNSFVSEMHAGTWELCTFITYKLTTLNWQPQPKLWQCGQNNYKNFFVAVMTCIVVNLDTCFELLDIGTLGTDQKFVPFVLLEAQHKQAGVCILVIVLATNTDCNQTEQIKVCGIFRRTLCNMSDNTVKMSNATYI
ncbi:hypothetical protein HPB49_005213 [Dermacentor silvarum]|uniref:Uncharacterized protein n=1 Tax=Dermacentor silvarum TaxID=543639 RepID=A0ACB8DVN9_DERSI|nr:hypothetical protein HPB49_005213 [Dermacentor silvarum]